MNAQRSTDIADIQTSKNNNSSVAKNVAIALLAVSTTALSVLSFSLYNEKTNDNNVHSDKIKKLEKSLENAKNSSAEISKQFDTYYQKVQSSPLHNLPINIGDNKTGYLDFNSQDPSSVILYTKENNNILVEETYTKNKRGKLSVTKINLIEKNESDEGSYYTITRSVPGICYIYSVSADNFQGSPLKTSDARHKSDLIVQFQKAKMIERQEEEKEEKLRKAQEVEDIKERNQDAVRRLREEKEELLHAQSHHYSPPEQKRKPYVPIRLGKRGLFSIY